MRILFDFFLKACYLIVSFYAFAAAADDSWQNLKHNTHERYYTVVDRKSNCITGRCQGERSRVHTRTSEPDISTFDRANVLRVSVSQPTPYLPPGVQADVGRIYDVIYNDKSSWSELKGVAGQGKIGASGQEVKVVKTDGKTYEGRLSTISATQLELDRTGAKLEIAKGDITQVYHLRPKPLTDSEKYSAQEDVWIDPRLWPYLLHLVPRLPVRLYDSSLPEDNTPLKCENDLPENRASQSCFVGHVQAIDLPNLTLRRRGKDPITMQVSKDAYVLKRGKRVGIDEITIGDQSIACGSITTDGFFADRVNIHK